MDDDDDGDSDDDEGEGEDEDDEEEGKDEGDACFSRQVECVLFPKVVYVHLPEFHHCHHHHNHNLLQNHHNFIAIPDNREYSQWSLA